MNQDFLGDTPMIKPLLLATEEITNKFTDEDGVANLWRGKTVTIPKGARLATKPYLRPVSSMTAILRIDEDKNLEPTSMNVEDSTENGFIFIIKVGRKLYEFLNNTDNDFTNNIYVFAISRCLSILQNDYKDDTWGEYQNLVMIAEQLQQKGLPLWDDEAFKPELVATQLYPLKIEEKVEDE